MDKPFINKMAQSYLSDYRLFESNIWSDENECITELIAPINEAISYCKKEDMDLYKSLFEINRQDQYQILYYMFDSHMFQTYDNDTLEDIYGDDFEEINESVLTLLAGASSAVMQSFANLVAALFGNPSTVIIGISAYMFWRYRKHLTRATFRLFDLFVICNNKIFEFIENNKTLQSGSVKTAVLYQSINSCGKKCGVDDWKEITPSKPIPSKHVIFDESHEKTECITKCYLDGLLKAVSILAQSYKQCMLKSSEFKPLKDRDIVDLEVVLSSPDNELCQPSYKLLIENFNLFGKVVNYMFDSSQSKLKQDYRKRYINNLYSALSRR